MLKLIREFCKKAKCQPGDLKLEWTPSMCPKVVALGPRGKRAELQIFASMDEIAQTIYLCATGQEHRYPDLQRRNEAIRREIKAIEQDKPSYEREFLSEANEEEDIQETTLVSKPDWRNLETADEILKSFPTRPTTDDLIDLYELNKVHSDQSLKNLLYKYSR